jgi:hypothetical protein
MALVAPIHFMDTIGKIPIGNVDDTKDKIRGLLLLEDYIVSRMKAE